VRLTLNAALIAFLAAVPLAAAEGGLFTPNSWADSSGADGNGGVKLLTGLNAQGNKILPLSLDDCGLSIDDPAVVKRPDWVAFGDQQGRTSLAFEWVWVTQGDKKFWDKTWAGAGLAFNASWAPLDATGARFLVAMVKASHPDPSWELRLSLNSKVGGKDVNSGGLSIRDFADGRKLGPTWTRVVIPLEAFPNAAALDLAKLGTLGIDLGGTLLENETSWVRLDNVHFTDTQLLTAPSRLGWLQRAQGVLVDWDLPGSAPVDAFVLSVDGKEAMTLKGDRRQALLPAALFAAQPRTLGLRAVRGEQRTAELSTQVALRPLSRAQAVVKVGAQARHRVSPWLFGNNNLSAGMAKGMRATVNRWGGNRKTRYNWKDDADSAAADWFYLHEAWSPPGAPEQEKSWYRFVQDSFAAKAQVNLVIPIIDRLAKRPPAGQRLCSFPLSLFPQQASNDGQGCGNGHLPDGTKLWGNDPDLTSVPNSPELQREWVRTVVRHFGTAAKGGVRFYSMDNEPGLWADTHRDVRPKGIGYDETLRLNLEYARAVKEADPSAEVMGLVAWGVKELAGSNLDYYGQGPEAYKQPDKFGPGDARFFDRKRHGDLPLVQWYLRQLRQAEKEHGRRLIDWLDVHWYPETYGKDSQGVVRRLSSDLPYDPALAPQQFEALREFWDPGYVNELSWTANQENRGVFWDPFHPLIPRLRALIQAEYPGTKLAVTEYDTGSRSHYHGALLRTVALGIFMEQGLEAANSWYETRPDKHLYWAHKLFMDYDGQGSNVLGWSMPVSSPHPDLYAFATARQGRAHLILVNKSKEQGLQSSLELPWDAAAMRSFVIAESAGPGILALPSSTVQGRRLQVDVPAWSAMLVELSLKVAR
jgi:hypothetical protein